MFSIFGRTWAPQKEAQEERQIFLHAGNNGRHPKATVVSKKNNYKKKTKKVASFFSRKNRKKYVCRQGEGPHIFF